MQRQFYTLDVFTSRALSGNPLAVVLDSAGLDAGQMLQIAREFNLSETAFVLEPRDPVNTARIRIFTPARELPFAGHPTVGTAALLGLLRAPQMMVSRDVGVMIEEEVGTISCTVRHLKGQAVRACFTVPQVPEVYGVVPITPVIASALGLKPGDTGFDNHVPTLFSAGVPYTFVPVKNRDVLARALPQASQWGGAFGGNAHRSAYLYTRDVSEAGHAFSTRMFFPLNSIVEDPATGSAAAAFAGVIAQFDKPGDGDHTLVLEQGYQMGRPSQITLGLDMLDGRLTGASIGGYSMVVSKGTLEV